MTPPRTWPSIEIRFEPGPPDRRAGIDERIAAVLDECQPVAVAESDDRWVASFPSESARADAAGRLAETLGDEAMVEAVDLPDDDWAARSQASLDPVRAGRIVVTPPWHEAGVRRDPAAIVIVVEPSMGFGTGHHATTRLCLLAIQQIPIGARSVLDIGTGSGVLAMAAARLGAMRVVAIDNDTDAVESARGNVALNGLAAVITLVSGDVRALSGPPFDVVVANLTGALIESAAWAIQRAVVPGGHLVLSGFMTAERDRVVGAFAGAHRVVWERSDDEWGAVALQAVS